MQIITAMIASGAKLIEFFSKSARRVEPVKFIRTLADAAEIELDLRTAQIRYRDLVGAFPTSALSLPSPPPAPTSVDQLVQTRNL